MQDLTLDKIIKFTPIVALALSFLAIITAISIAYFVNWWRLRKSLAYIVKTYTAIFSIDPELGEKIQILYDGKPITNAKLFVITLVNDGRQPVEKKDFSKESIDFVFSEGGQILSSEVIHTNPADLKVEKEEEENVLSIKPLLLNKGDSFEIKGVINSNDDKITCSARIVNIKEVKRINPSKPKFTLSFAKVILSLFTLLVAFVLILSENDQYKSIGLGLLVLLISYWINKIVRK